MDSKLKTVNVVAAVITDSAGRVFATQRGYGDMKGGWEFPGGKIEPGETPQQALRREIREELDAHITVGELITIVEWDYPAFHLTMQCFRCRLAAAGITLREHTAARWLAPGQLSDVDWLPADTQIVELLAR